MPRHRMKSGLLLILGSYLLGSIGCAHMTPTENGALAGVGLGTLTGAVIGHQSGHGEEGALIGALLGGLGGGMLGKNHELRQQRDMAIQQASYEQQQRAQAAALTNLDIIQMCNSGINPAIVIQAIETQPNAFDLTSNALIMLSQNHVPDEVIGAMQRNQYRKVEQVRTVIAPAPRPAVVVVEEPIIYHHRPWWYHRRHYHHHHHPPVGLHLHADF